MTPSELLAFCRLFDQEKFFEAHEVLEFLWRKTQDENRDFYHGLIQIAAAFVHVQKKTPEGGRQLFQKALQYLQKYPPVYQNFPLEKLIFETHQYFAASKSSGAAFPKIDLKV